jgi:drug/metabolite transporter (DMT)-like permease
MGFNWVLLFEAYKYTSVSIATLAYYFAPVIVAIACTFLFKEKMSSKNIVCFLFSTLGIVFVSGIVGTKADINQIKGFLFGLGAAILYATVILLNKKMKEVEGINRTCYQFLFAIMVLLPYVLISEGFNLVSLDSISWINLLILGVFHTGITYCLYFTSLKNLNGQSVAVLSYIDPLVAIIISFIIDEKMLFLQIIGGVLLITATILNEIQFEIKKRNIGNNQ